MEDYTELIKAVKTFDWGESGASLLLIDAEIRKIAGHAEHAGKLEAALLEILRSDASLAAKRGVCKRLGLIAGEQSIPVLAAMLDHADTSDMARYSLERMPSAAVDAALRSALARTSGIMRAGIIHSIGNRRDSQAVPALGELLQDADETVACASACALGRIGSAEAISRLTAHRNSAPGRVRREILDAYLVCARRLALEGRRAEARAMYRELNAESMPGPVRRAAKLGIEATGV
ncbi:MAG: HEAT repeat domain-containing protein [Bryobacteraceae bacterium]